MSDIVPGCYRRGASFRQWAYSRTLEGPSIRERLRAQREALLEEIDFKVWDPEQSRKLDLLDYLLGI